MISLAKSPKRPHLSSFGIVVCPVKAIQLTILLEEGCRIGCEVPRGLVLTWPCLEELVASA